MGHIKFATTMILRAKFKGFHSIYVKVYWYIHRYLVFFSKTWHLRSQFSRTTNSELESFFLTVKNSFITVPLIKIGGDSDGGYLVPDNIIGIDGVFSPGVGNLATFESDLLKYGMPIFMADASVSAPPIQGANVHFKSIFITPNPVEGESITLEEWINACAPNAENLILQMDIEGAEWQVLAGANLSILSRFRIIIVEFHACERIFQKKSFNEISSIFQKLLKDFDIVNLHPNNGDKSVKIGRYSIPPLIEITFYRKKESRKTPGASMKYSYSSKNHVNDPRYPQPSFQSICRVIEKPSIIFKEI